MDFEFEIFQHPGFQGAPVAGSLLVASPRLREPYFRNGVVLLLERDEKMGYLGLTVNLRTKLTLSDLMRMELPAGSLPVFSGGPVDETRLFMIHTLGEDVGAIKELLPGIYVGGELEQLASFLKTEETSERSIRFYLGYSGWSEGQLEEEIDEGYWGVRPPEASGMIFDGDGKDFWRKAVRMLGENYKSWLLMPDDPRDN